MDDGRTPGSRWDEPPSSHARRGADENAARLAAIAAARLERERFEAAHPERSRFRPSSSQLRVLILVVLAVGGLVGGAALLRGRPGPVSANLEQVGAMHLAFGAQSSGGVSPACGCDNPSANVWRGVSFAARQVTIERSSEAEHTEWYFTVPEPSSIRIVGGLRRLSAETVTFKPHGQFDPSSLIDGTLETHATDVQRRTFKSPGMKLINEGKLHVAMLGPTPIGSWMPLPGSEVSLGAEHSSFPDETTVPRLSERYSPDSGETAKTEHTRRQRYPLGDFLGPDLVFWTDDPEAILTGTEPDKENLPGTYKALIIRDEAFAVRVAAIPMPSLVDAVDNWTSMADVIQLPDTGPGEAGEVEVKLNAPLVTGEYDAIRERLLAEPNVEVKEWTDAIVYRSAEDDDEQLSDDIREVIDEELRQRGDFSGVDGGTTSWMRLVPAWGQSDEEREQVMNTVKEDDSFFMTTAGHGAGDQAPDGMEKIGEQHGYTMNTYHWPPLPPSAYFNVFGPLKSLTIEKAIGSMLVGDGEVKISAPGTVELTGLDDLRDSDGRQLLTPPLLTSGAEARLQFSGAATLKLNGVDQGTRSRLTGPKATALMIVLSALALALAAAGFLVTRRPQR